MNLEFRKQVLVTAFEPFGFHGMLTGRNKSVEVVQQFKLANSSIVEGLYLPVSDKAVDILLEQLHSKPFAGVISVGEQMLSAERGVLVGVSAEKDGAEVRSSYAEQLISDVDGLSSGEMGDYYCNDLYFAAIKAGRQIGVPVVFAHVPILGNTQYMVDQMDAILKHMLSVEAVDQIATQ